MSVLGDLEVPEHPFTVWLIGIDGKPERATDYQRNSVRDLDGALIRYTADLFHREAIEHRDPASYAGRRIAATDHHGTVVEAELRTFLPLYCVPMRVIHPDDREEMLPAVGYQEPS